MHQISWTDFEAVELRVGTIVKVEAFPEAKKPGYKIVADSEFLLAGFSREDGSVVLAVPERAVPNGAKLG